MIIRKIMKITGIVILLCVGVVIGYLFYLFPVIMSLIIGSGFTINGIVWGSTFDMDDYRKCKKHKIWYNINFSIYTLGIYWVVKGLIYLWKNAEDIEDEIKMKRTERINKKEFNIDGGA